MGTVFATVEIDRRGFLPPFPVDWQATSRSLPDLVGRRLIASDQFTAGRAGGHVALSGAADLSAPVLACRIRVHLSDDGTITAADLVKFNSGHYQAGIAADESVDSWDERAAAVHAVA